MEMDLPALSLLQLLQLADSALPVGSMSHSVGLEALVFDEDIEQTIESCPASLRRYLEDSLSESLLVEGVYCREAHARGARNLATSDLNEQFSALRLARESREASLTMGRRFAALASNMLPAGAISRLRGLGDLHHPVAFGFTLGVLAIDPDLTVSAFLHQSVLSSISAAQRLLPLGQMQANRIAWDLKPAILNAMRQTKSLEVSTVCSFAPMPEMASMRHATLPSRLFIS